MKNKIVLAIFTLQGNGAERFALTLAKGLVDAGHEAHIVYFKNIIDLPVPENIQLHFFDYQKYRAIPKFMRTGFAARAFDQFVLNNIGIPDLVLSNLYPVDFILAHSQLPNVHLVIHNTTSQEYAKQLTPQFIEQLKKTYLAKSCIGVSEGVTQDFRLLFGEQSQIKTIYNPIDVDVVRNAANEFIPEYQDYIVHVGKFKQQKRHDILIKAYAKANVPQKLVLVGTGELMEASRQLLKELNIEEKVIFAGFQKNPYPFIKHAKLMVFSSDFEGLGLVILEAVALGTPVISTDCPSGPSEILPSVNLVQVGDSDLLGKKIQDALSQNGNFKITLQKQFFTDVAVKSYVSLITQ